MATITTVSPSGTMYQRTGTAQADTGQTDWINVPSWAKYALVILAPVTFGGTTPVCTPSLLALAAPSVDEVYAQKVAEHTAFTGLTTSPVNEVQTLTLTAGAAADVIHLTFNGHESTGAVTFPAGGYANVTAALVKTALLTISDWIDRTADIAVVKTVNDYAITFTGQLGRTDVGAISVTTVTGTAAGSVAETTKGVPGARFVAVIGPSVTGIADDVTNSATADSYVSLNTVLPPILGVKLLLDRTSGNEVYTYTLQVIFKA